MITRYSDNITEKVREGGAETGSWWLDIYIAITLYITLGSCHL